MRVLLTADAVGGVWTYAVDLCRGLSAGGHTVTLAVSGPAAGATRLDEARDAGATIVETGLPLDWLAHGPDEVLAAGRAHAALAREVGADIVHLNSPALAAQAMYPCPLVGFAHSCVATWWEAVRGGALPGDFAWRTELLARGYARCDALAAPSAAFARATQRTYGLHQRPVVIHNGRAQPLSAAGRGRVGASRPGEGERPLRTPRPPSPHPLPIGGRDPALHSGGAVVALTAGRLWDEAKNLATLDRTAARTAVPIAAAGPVEGPNGMRMSLRHLRLLGPLTPADLAAHLAKKPIFISLARYEPFGLAVLEAAQAGCPLVLSGIPTFRELWDGAAVFVDPDDDRAAATALNELASDEAARTRLGALALGRAASYGVERMIEGTLALYASTLANANRLRAAS